MPSIALIGAHLEEILPKLQKTDLTLSYSHPPTSSLDAVYVVASPTEEATLSVETQKLLSQTASHAQHHLILPQNSTVKSWLQTGQYHLHHHIHTDADYARLFRFMQAKATALVLSGGGAKGWAHLGALKALCEKEIPIDAVCGTSVGAIIAACFAKTLSYHKTQELFTQITKTGYQLFSLNNLTWPRASLFSAKTPTRGLQTAFGTQCIEDLLLPFFCISSNLSKGMEHVHTTGPLWHSLRASSSLPGLIPPVIIEGDPHVDGGLLNTLPTDVMRTRMPGVRIIAVDITKIHGDPKKYHSPPILNFTETLLQKHRAPRLFDVMLRCLQMGSLAKSKNNQQSADLLITPDLNAYRMFNFSRKLMQKFIDIGYETACEQLERYNESSSSTPGAPTIIYVQR